MKANLLLCSLAMGFMLSGCADVWVKPGATQADFNKDSYECDREVGPTGEGWAGLASWKADYRACMRYRGWEIK